MNTTPIQFHSNPNSNAKTRHTSNEVMDVLPWPQGYGFDGGESWWKRVLNQSDYERLDNLIGLALLDRTMCERLVVDRDRSLLASFGLSEQTQEWLVSVKANTLKEFAQAIVNRASSSGASAEAA